MRSRARCVHWRTTSHPQGAAELSAGEKRWRLVLAGTILQLGLGTIYAWSYFQSLLIKWYRWTYIETALAFSLLILTIGVSAAWGGFNLPRLGARRLAVIGSALFGVSFLLGGLALHFKSPPLFYLGFSVVGGLGVGLGYVTPVSTVAKWFPDAKGLVTGVVVMGFGFGAFFMSKLLAPIFLRFLKGDLVATFCMMSVLFLVVLVPISSLLREPSSKPTPAEKTAPVIPSSPRVYLLSGAYARLWLMFFFNIGAGIAVISLMSPMLQEIWGIKDPTLEPVVLAEYGATLIAVSSLFNGVGRLFWALISDRFGRILTLRIIIASQLVVFGVLLIERDPWIFSALICYVLLCFGGGFGVMPAFVSEVFGEKNMPIIYGTLLTAWSSAGVAGPLIVAALADGFPDRALLYCLLTGVLFLACAFIASYLSDDDPYEVL